jgi:putative sigma-54 modulation protein
MRLTVTLRNGEDESWQKEYVEEKMKKLDKYIDAPAEARVVLQVEKFRNTADIGLQADGLNINSKEEAKDMRLAIDNAVDKLERQLKKHREKTRTHKAGLSGGRRSGGNDRFPRGGNQESAACPHVSGRRGPADGRDEEFFCRLP